MPETIQTYQPNPELQVSDHFFRTGISGLWYLQAEKNSDQRGFFSEIVSLPELEQVIGRSFPVKQINHARSQTNVVRGMHAEGWNKLVTATNGLVFSAIADIRPDSETFKQIKYFKLGSDHQTEFVNGLFISQGLANSVCVLEGPVSYIYLVDKLYSERDEKDDLSISIFDSDLNIDWPISRNDMVLSERDKNAVSLQQMLAEKQAGV